MGFPAVMAALLIMVSNRIQVSENRATFLYVKGPGAQRAPFIISLAAGLFIGAIAQRSRFCTMGSLRDIILTKDFHLASGVVTLLIFATVF